MEKIFSKVEPEILLHMVRRLDDIVNQKEFRVDLVSSDNFIQCSSLRLKKGKTFKPHHHIFRQRTFYKLIAQESWCCIRGKIKCVFYDLDNSIVAERILYPGDSSFTLRGGHNYVSMEENSIVYEYKTGPYEGQEVDKKFIE